MHALDTLLSDTAFWVAVAATAVGATAALRVGRELLGGPSAAVVGVMLGLAVTDRLPVTLAGAVIALSAGALATRSRGVALRAVAVVPGAVLVGVAAPDYAATWMAVAGAVATVPVAVAAVHLDGHASRWSAIVLVALALGVYGAVPDTEPVRAFLGAVITLAVIHLVLHPVPDVMGSAALAGVLTWAAVAGGQSRPGAVVGALGCAGVLVIVVFALELGARDSAALVVAVAMAAVASRVAGLREGRWEAGLIVGAAYVLGGIALLATRSRRARSR